MYKIKIKDYKHMCLDIIENDNKNEYGYSTIYDTEDYLGEIVYGCAVYKYRLPINETGSYKEAVELLNYKGDAGMTECSNITDAINVHFDWWLQKSMTPEEIGELDVFIGTYEEITDFLKRGFNEPRIFFSCIEWYN